MNGTKPVVTFPVNLEAVTEITDTDKPWLATGHWNGSVVYVVCQREDDEPYVQTFLVGPYSIELRAVRL